ncbi:DUF3055 domain-containing protein [Bacillus sp. V5-8f]|uniref:DUF3055 domain-containing protein n=1 Tax=Bacillus sp. V5-8f TaxID=2053044 RepID=UPI000C775A60|nr:DUF3055 domain-containing protein [Bacillus sp. V5-8f]PLT34355.1 hypothetical protein CUU64_09000 [Bacillus sp. V5-8f]
MELFEKLYDENETVKVRFVGFTGGETRFDFGIVYTNMFFGKPLVICMQTGRSTLLELKDIQDLDFLQAAFKIKPSDSMELAEFFKELLPEVPFQSQYE